MPHLRRLAIVAVVVAMTLIGACGQDEPSSQDSAPQRILVSGAVAGLVDAGLPQSLLDAADHPSTLLLMQEVGTNTQLPDASPTLTYHSVKDLTKALENNEIPDSMDWLLLDLEGWAQTPRHEQSDPIGALQEALDAAHEHGKRVIFAPAITLMDTLAPGLTGDALYQAFIDQLVTPGAAIADGFEIQSQRTQATDHATTFVRDAVQAAIAVNPDGAPVFAGVSTNPNGREMTVDDLVEVYDAAMAAGATGYWLNVPSGGKECPKCGKPRYDLGVEFLTEISSN
ncbi:hypothetical protein AAFP30_11190 [Gordonia sp. CPCC 205515]|uniref:hypothetical protein n=1 Tax=Gordonia sp. CPCC 205515 TaxID=3140791 RepID=UPI003AF38EE5